VLYNLLAPLSDEGGIFNLFRYLTFRTGAAILFSLALTLLIGPVMIRWLKKVQREGQPIRDDGPQSHLVTKKGTPTMGGFMILLALSIAILLWADLTNAYVWIALLVTVSFGAIGFVDDYLKVTKRNSKGVPGRIKLLIAVIIAAIAAWLIMRLAPAGR
jgi:phospho-N-acetylmuramoyl-pentapeptide-transferase